MHTYSFFIHHAGSLTHELMFAFASDRAVLKSLAEKALAESGNCLAVEIREEDRLVFCLDRDGAIWPVQRQRKPH